MNWLLLGAVGIGWWALSTRDAKAMRFGDIAAVVGALIGLKLFTRGETLPAIAAIAGAGYWFWARRRDAPASMTAAQAARLLDVAPDASQETIRAAHRRLVARVHPDAGGSADLAAQVNAARDVLLARRT